MPLPRQLLQIDFDQFHRYAALTVLLKPLLHHYERKSTRPLRLLEVGSHSLNLLPAFLAPIPVEIVRADLEPHLAGDLGPYITLNKDEPFPFVDDAFDIVVAMEVLEHIPAEDRMFAVGEWSRVASKGVFFSCPNGKRVRKLEARADADFQARHNREHPWLEEHERFGRPTRREVDNLCDMVGITCHRFYNSPLAEWLPLLLATEQIFEQGDTALTRRFNEMLNLRPFRAFIQEPGYRTMYAGFKTEQLDQEAKRVWQKREALADVLESGLDPTRILARQLSEFVREHHHHAVSMTMVQSAQRLLQETKETLSRTEEQLLWERWLRQYESPTNRVRCFESKPTITPEIQYQLKDFGPSHWSVMGEEATLIWPMRLERGWHQIEIAAEVKAGYALYFTVGVEDGFNDDTTITLENWKGSAERRRFNFFVHHPVKRLRLQLSQSDGEFVLQQFKMKSVSKVRVAAQGMVKLLGQAVRSPRRTWNASRSYASVFHYGMQLTAKDSHATPLIPSPSPQRGEGSQTPYQRYLHRSRPTLAQRKQVIRTLAFVPDRLAYLLEVKHGEQINTLQQTFDSLSQQDECKWELWVAVRADLLPACQAIPHQLEENLRWLIVPADMGQASLIRHCTTQHDVDWLMLLQPGDTLEVDASAVLLETSWKNREAALLYADEDYYLPHRGEVKPQLKPVIEAETLRYQTETLGEAVALHVPTLQRLGGLNPTYDGALVTEYLHRLLQSQSKLVRIKRVLLHKADRLNISPAVKLVHERLAEDYASYSITTTRQTVSPRQTSASPTLYESGLVSILIPSAGKLIEQSGKGLMHLERCLASLRTIPSGAKIEIIVVDQENLSSRAVRVIKQYDAQRISVPGPFNFSLSINVAARVARGEHLLLLNDDTEVISQRWLEQMLHVMGEGVGAVGARLLFSTGAIQHLGISIRNGVPIHPLYGQRDQLTSRQPGNCWAVTGACLLTPHHVFDAAAGFDESFELNYNDVDYCLRLRQLGYRLVMHPGVELYHHEAERVDGRAAYRPEELARFQQRWLGLYHDDPYWRHQPWGDAPC
jgi:GT2 family glycosyltransferase/SAM-dependent methyltransferase